jgi:hypothetical protein
MFSDYSMTSRREMKIKRPGLSEDPAVREERFVVF